MNIKVILSGKIVNILSVILIRNVPIPRSTGQNKINIPKTIPTIDEKIPA